jgi:hypothetical protein
MQYEQRIRSELQKVMVYAISHDVHLKGVRVSRGHDWKAVNTEGGQS